MMLRPTHRNESQTLVTPTQAGVHAGQLDSRSPAFAEDKLRGNDVTFDGAQRGILRSGHCRTGRAGLWPRPSVPRQTNLLATSLDVEPRRKPYVLDPEQVPD